MAERLNLEDVATLLQSDVDTIRGWFEAGRLHGVRRDGTWTTTRELLEADLELLTESARIDRFRAGTVPQPGNSDACLDWLSIEWVEAGLAAVRT